jgi:hypothetical protein
MWVRQYLTASHAPVTKKREGMRHPQTLRSEDLSDIFEREGYGFELSALAGV